MKEHEEYAKLMESYYTPYWLSIAQKIVALALLGFALGWGYVRGVKHGS